MFFVLLLYFRGQLHDGLCVSLADILQQLSLDDSYTMNCQGTGRKSLRCGRGTIL